MIWGPLKDLLLLSLGEEMQAVLPCIQLDLQYPEIVKRLPGTLIGFSPWR